MENLSHQPATLDDRIEIPENAPRAQGHSEEDAAAHQEALAEHKQAIQDTPEEDVGAREPGDHAEGKSKKKKSDD